MTWSRRLRWLALSAVPSSLILGTTTHLTTDVGSIPLLWILPLALYLLTFIIVFSAKPVFPHPAALHAFPIGVLLAAALLLAHVSVPLVSGLAAHLGALFLASLALHGELARDRPGASELTGYYLTMSVGGVLGGAFNAFLAPLVFTSVVEYPLALVLACLLVPGPRARADLVYPAGLAALATAAVLLGRRLDVDPVRLASVTWGALAVASFSFSRRPLRFGLALASLFLVASLTGSGDRGELLLAQRSFFGVHRVFRTPSGLHVLHHGHTEHGSQRIDPATLRPVKPRDPLTYYGLQGPFEQLFRHGRTGAVGLGTGSIAAYALPGDRLVFHEIDPVVRAIAEDTRYFTFLAAARERGATVEVVLGDARLTLARSRETFDLLVLDAFSSDAIPVHLLTREAFEQVYLPRLGPDGLITLHISNRYLRLEPIVADAARSLGLAAWIREDLKLPEDEVARGRNGSTWMGLARTEKALGRLPFDVRWREARGSDGDPRPWTDRSSNLLRAIVGR